MTISTLTILRWGFWIGLAGVNVALVCAGWSRVDPESINDTRVESRSITTTEGRRIALEILRPTDHGTAPRAALMVVHGGSWRGGSVGVGHLGSRATIARLAQAGIVIVAVDYTLARPGAPSWPQALHDLRAVMRWLRREASSLEIDPQRIGVLGFSSGGQLASLLGTLPDETDADGVSSKPRVVIDFYGPTDLTQLESQRHLAHDPIAIYLDSNPREAASPLDHVSPDDPPFLILHGTADRWTPIEQSRRFAARLESQGVPVQLIEVEGARHGFEASVEFPRSIDLFPGILAFLNSVWNPQ